VRNGVDPSTIVATGIPIRPSFGAVQSLKLPAAGAPLEVLVTSGGFGVGPMLAIVRSFAGVPSVRLTVICGDNPARVEQTRRAAEEAGVDAEVLGFERDMPRRMAAAHVLVGKPGGLTASESLAAGRPMVIVGACPGQEMMNQTWMIDQGVAVAADPTAAGAVVADLVRSGKIPELAAAARALAAPNAAARVADVALRITNRAPTSTRLREAA
jgi:processive 1,2-diacylglycerol beta-glucosyltransferase